MTGVGGLADTVVDLDRHPDRGNGFVAAVANSVRLLDAMHRAVRSVHDNSGRRTIQRRGMKSDWSWEPQAQRYVDAFSDLIA